MVSPISWKAYSKVILTIINPEIEKLTTINTEKIEKVEHIFFIESIKPRRGSIEVIEGALPGFSLNNKSPKMHNKVEIPA